MSQNPLEPTSQNTPWRPHAIAITGLAVLIICHFRELLFFPGDLVISHYSGDVSQFFIRMREFGFSELREGRIPLWNPHVMSGTPFVGNWQSALFYPLNFPYLLLPVGHAVNVDIALHTFLFALFVYTWVASRSVHPLAAFFSAAVAAFSAPLYLRVLAGHTTMLAAMTWAPLLLLTIDQIYRRASENRPLLGWSLIGIAVTSLQILAGHPQTVFITGVTVGLYCLVLFPGATNRWRIIAALAPITIFPLFITAIQLWTGLQMAGESMRAGGTGYSFATSFSFPPENLLTLLSPAFFGDRVNQIYWGRWAFWDANAFLGITTIILAAYGALHAPRDRRRYATFMAIILLFVAMGRNSAVYDLFYTIPIFDLLRGPSKFLFVFVLFAALLAGLGADRLLRQPDAPRSRRMSLLILAGLPPIALGAFWILFSIGGPWEDTPWRALLDEHQFEGWILTKWTTLGDDYFDRSSLNAAAGLAIALLTAALAAFFLWRTATARTAAYALVLLGIVEVFTFAETYRITFPLTNHDIPEVEAVYEANPGDYRVLHIGDTDDPRNPRNHPMKVGRSSLWGYEPVFLERYGVAMSYAAGGGKDFVRQMIFHSTSGSDAFDMALTQDFMQLDVDPDTAKISISPLLQMLRCRYVIVPPDRDYGQEGIYESTDYLPRFLLMSNYLVLPNPIAAMETVAEYGFDLRESVILEEPPLIVPDIGADQPDGDIRILDQSTDHVTLQVELDHAAILLITDPYNVNWKIEALAESAQSEYTLTPANVLLQAIALGPGQHRFQIAYKPSGFTYGRITTIVALALYLALVSLWIVQASRRHSTKYDA